MVGAFHGYAHNRACQLHWHPLYITGTGLTEGEGCEHIFSSSNDIARNTRHGSRFHRKQAIEEHFTFWDIEKYALLSKFLVNHYREASQLIRGLEEEVAEHKKKYGISNDDFDLFIRQEQQYFKDLDGPHPATELKKQYVKLLRDLTHWHCEYNSARAAVAQAFESIATTDIHIIIEQARNRIEKAVMMCEATQNQLVLAEASLGVKERWTAEHPEYKEYYQENVITQYQNAVDELERLVVMRLFELLQTYVMAYLFLSYHLCHSSYVIICICVPSGTFIVYHMPITFITCMSFSHVNRFIITCNRFHYHMCTYLPYLRMYFVLYKSRKYTTRPQSSFNSQNLSRYRLSSLEDLSDNTLIL
ncbi:hypothetical protein F5887DRAFT_896614 [Amanita rubescens]|nr:hypothetical protein F5887DRAFT_896614 [Amanita rubescens]